MSRKSATMAPAITALLAHVPCCLPPILLAVSGGASGLTWLHALEPYKNWFIGFALLQVAVMFVIAMRSKDMQCCEHHKKLNRKTRFKMAWISLCVTGGIIVLGNILTPVIDKH